MFRNMHWVTGAKTHKEAIKIYQFLKRYFGFKDVIIRHTNLYNIYLPNSKKTQENIIQWTYGFSEELNKNIYNGAIIISKNEFNEKLLNYKMGL